MEAGYLGVGAMGQPMAHKLLDAGHTLTIYDINEAAMRPLLERQARRAAKPKPRSRATAPKPQERPAFEGARSQREDTKLKLCSYQQNVAAMI